MATIIDEKTKALNLARQVSHLAFFRDELAQAKAQAEALQDEFEKSAAWQAVEARIRNANDGIGVAKVVINDMALEQFREQGDKHPHDAITVKEITELEYDEKWATAWCKDNMAMALKLDSRAFEKYARAVVDVMPVPGVTLVKVPQVTIASDLSKYVKLPFED